MNTYDKFMLDLVCENLTEEEFDLVCENLTEEEEQFLISEKGRKIGYHTTSGSGSRNKKMKKSLGNCPNGQRRVGKRGCADGVTSKKKIASRKAVRTGKKSKRNASGMSKRLSGLIGKVKSIFSRKRNK